MKKSVVLILILLASITGYANPSCCTEDWKVLREEGDRFFDLEQYNLAIRFYRQLADEGGDDSVVTYRLAECYRKTFNYPEAESYYFKVYCLAPSEFKLSPYYYGLMLKLNGKYDESIRYLDEFILRNEHDNELLPYVEQAMIDRAGSESALTDTKLKNERYALTLESINSSFNDFAPVAADSSKLFLTSGRTSSSIAAIDERYGEGFTDNYYFEKSGGKWHDRTRQSIRNLNTRFNDGSGCINNGKYYFTICGKESSQCRIVVSRFRSGRWTDPVPLNDNINDKRFETKHPAVSPGGDTLLFVTNRPGGLGGLDIWMSIDAGDEDWGPAMNLGPMINTKMNEVAPAFADFNHLFFFASEGHQGFGGMDLYMAKRFSDGEQSVCNLGYPFNSNRDDCFISFSNRELYISSNREGGMGGFDIYSSSITSPLAFVSRLSLRNRSGRSDVTLASLKTDGMWMDLFSSRKEDRIEYESLTYDRRVIVDKMIASKSKHKDTSIKEFNGITEAEYRELDGIAERQYRKLEMQRKYRETYLARVNPISGAAAVAVSGVLVDSLTGQPMASVNIFMMNEHGEVVKATTTNDLGIFRFTNVTGPESYFLRFEGQGRSNSKPVLKDLLVVRDTPDTFTFDNIYFDTDHYDLRPEAKEILNKLGDFLKFIPDSQVEIFAYADDRGTDTYNFQLTKKRGETVRAYLGTIGVDETAIAIVAKGRQAQHEDPENDEKRQFNRRVEFYINGEKSNSLITADSNK